MILVRLMGGLGNQMFQYAFGRSQSIAFNTELALDKSLLEDRSMPNEVVTYRNFDLDIFKGLSFRLASDEEIFLYNGAKEASLVRRAIRKVSVSFSPKKVLIQKNNEINLDFEDNTCYVGRWQSYRFFENIKDIIKVEFKLDQPSIEGIEKVKSQIKKSNSICLHVRRADLVTSSLYNKLIGELDLEYYNKAINHFSNTQTDASYFVFSDDIEWCKQNIRTGKETFFVENKFAGKKAEGHLFLMQQCKHFIISNSTFAWWAAFLSEESKNKVVIYPKNWYKDAALQNPDMCPREWKAL